MNAFNKNDPLLLFVGDIVFLFFSLWLMLLIRYGSGLTFKVFGDHFLPFGILFVIWCIVFFIAGLYEKHTALLQRNVPRIILNAQVANSIIAITFFYFIPYFGITPKTNLFIYLVISFLAILFWRMYGYKFTGARHKQNALLVGSGAEVDELYNEVNNNPRAAITITSRINLDEAQVSFQQDIAKRVDEEGISVIIADLSDKHVEQLLPKLYTLIFSHVTFIDMYAVYEDVFNRIPLSLLTYGWFLEHISLSPKLTYDLLKRGMDIIVSAILGVISLILYPFIILAIKIDDGGSVFIVQERIGKNGRIIHTRKFRTMQRNEMGLEMNLNKSTPNKVTRVGKFLRRTRLDELPQLWAVVVGNMSLIGPRPELPSGVERYEREIPYYNIRHLIKPGLSGWAQIYHDNHPHHTLGVDATKEKLSYDLYYLKNRSFILDVTIGLKTISKLLFPSGA